MSFAAVAWVLKQDFARSSEKFLLVCLANYADERMYCYPSVAALERDTAQDRKTILGNLARLETAGLIRDTKRRTGATGQIPVYQLLGVPEASKAHYVYRLTDPDTGEFYIGKRSYTGDIDADTYRGSGRWPRSMMEEGKLLVRDVLKVFETNEEAWAYETQLIRAADGDPLCRNEDTRSKCRARGLGSQDDLFTPPGRPVKGTVPKTDPFPGAQESRFSEATVPKTATEQSQKRDTEPTSKPIKEPVTTPLRGASDSFDRFWDTWPSSPRKVDKAKCLDIWTRKKLQLFTDAILAHVEACKTCDQWMRGFEPAPRTYLNGKRWLDGAPVDGPGGPGAPRPGASIAERNRAVRDAIHRESGGSA